MKHENTYLQEYEYPEGPEFAHAIYGGDLCGRCSSSDTGKVSGISLSFIMMKWQCIPWKRSSKKVREAAELFTVFFDFSLAITRKEC